MKIVISAVVFLILAVLGAVYVKISAPKPVTVEEKPAVKLKKKADFNDFDTKRYDFPVRVAYLKFDLKSVKHYTLYKAEIDVNDKFTLFNLKELLKFKNIPFTIKEGKKIKIYILFRNLKEARSVINLLKEYNFNIKLKKEKGYRWK